MEALSSGLTLLSGGLLLLGALVMLIGAAGMLRLPDFYSRLHAAGKGDSLGQVLILLGLMIPAGLSLVSLKLALIVFFIFVCNPTATYALARAAWRLGERPAVASGPIEAGDPPPPPLGDAELARLYAAPPHTGVVHPPPPPEAP